MRPRHCAIKEAFKLHIYGAWKTPSFHDDSASVKPFHLFIYVSVQQMEKMIISDEHLAVANDQTYAKLSKTDRI
jgi:hypothetical protein